MGRTWAESALAIGFLAAFCFADSVGLPGPYEVGLAELNNGDFAGAESQFHEALRVKPDDLRALFRLADVKLRQGRPHEAEEPLRRALAIAPREPAVYRAWGRYLAIEKRFTEAEESFRKAVALSHGDVSPEMDLADFYLLGPHKIKEAVETYRSVIAKNPAHAGAHYALGRILMGSGNTVEAEAELQQAARLDPAAVLAPEALGELYLRRRQYNRALEMFSTAVKLKADFVPAHVGLGDSFWGKGDASSAAKEYLTAAQLAPKEASLQIRLAMMDQWFGKTQEAEQAYLAAIRLDPKAAVAYNNLAWMEVERKTRLEDAQKWAEAAVNLNSKIPAFQVTLAWTYRARGNLGKATTILETSAAAHPDTPEVLYRLGIVYSETGNTIQAANYLEKALASNLDSREAKDIRKRLEALKQRPPSKAAPQP